MKPLSFKEYLSMVNEDAAQEIAKLQSDIAAVDTQIAASTAPLMKRKDGLQRMLALKMKQAQADQKNAGPAQNPQQQAPTGSMTAQPGSTGAQTPGGGAAL